MTKLNREVLYLQASGHRKSLLGEQHSSVATTLKILAGLYYYQGRYDQAEELLVEALEQRKLLLEEKHSSVATTLNNLAGLYYYQGRHDQAEELLVEALELLRLRDEKGNLVLPMKFIPAAERYDLMHLIDRWVIRTLFRNWTRVVGEKQIMYGINLSGSSINDDQFINFLYEQFSLYSISPQCICFEITETVAIANLNKGKQFIESLQRMGCSFALDDFGVGMSSFAYLKSLPVDYLKIDGSFIRNIIDNPVDNAIVIAMTHISSVMGIKTIAEFVENDAILERIRELGIDYAQGYGIALPRPLGSI